MKVTTEDNVKDFVLYEVNNVFIGFNDDTEIVLNNIIDYDFDLDKIECSTIGLTSLLNNVEIENYFVGNKKNNIIYIHIEAKGVIGFNGELVDVFYDIPCNMTIRRLRISGNSKECGNMYIELEGFVR